MPKFKYEEVKAELDATDVRINELLEAQQRINEELPNLVNKRNYLAGIVDALSPEDPTPAPLEAAPELTD